MSGHSTTLTAREFQSAGGTEDWRVLGTGASAWYAASSHREGAALVAALAGADHGVDLDLDVRATGVRARLPLSPLDGGFRPAHVDAARAVAQAAAGLGLVADPTVVQDLQLTFDVLDQTAVSPFWETALGYDAVGDEDLMDPGRRHPPIWFQDLDAPRPLRNRLHLDAVVGHVLESLRPVAARADLTLAERIDPAEVTGDSLQLERAVTNLVSNAIKFTPEGGSVTVTLTADDDAATVTVADTGIGIPEAEHEHLGTRFFRSSTAQRGSIPGTGLGLSIVQAIAEGHDGGLDFDSAEGEGTTFRLTVPLHHVDAPGDRGRGRGGSGGRGPTTA